MKLYCRRFGYLYVELEIKKSTKFGIKDYRAMVAVDHKLKWQMEAGGEGRWIMVIIRFNSLIKTNKSFFFYFIRDLEKYGPDPLKSR